MGINQCFYGKEKIVQYMNFPKKYNWLIEDTYYNDNHKKTLEELMDEIDAALQIGDRRWFMDASREYNALKMEGTR